MNIYPYFSRDSDKLSNIATSLWNNTASALRDTAVFANLLSRDMSFPTMLSLGAALDSARKYYFAQWEGGHSEEDAFVLADRLYRVARSIEQIDPFFLPERLIEASKAYDALNDVTPNIAGMNYRPLQRAYDILNAYRNGDNAGYVHRYRHVTEQHLRKIAEKRHELQVVNNAGRL